VEESRIFSTKEENHTRQSSKPNTTTCTRAHESPARHTQTNGVPERKQRAQPKKHTSTTDSEKERKQKENLIPKGEKKKTQIQCHLLKIQQIS
jgi:hypothetical protein